MPRAQLHINIGGQKRFAKYTLNTFFRYDKDAEEDGAGFRMLVSSQMGGLLKLTRYALDYPGNNNKLPENFDDEMVSDWIDELPQKDLNELVATMMNSVKKFGDAFVGRDQESVKKEKS